MQGGGIGSHIGSSFGSFRFFDEGKHGQQESLCYQCSRSLQRREHVRQTEREIKSTPECVARLHTEQ